MNMGFKILGVCGKAGSGKDTIAEYLVDNYGYTKMAFADPIKRFLLKSIEEFSSSDFWGESSLRNQIKHIDWDQFEDNIEKDGEAWLKSLMPFVSPEALKEHYLGLYRWFEDMRDSYEDGGVSPRHLLQSLGTGYGRTHLGEDIWVDILLENAFAVLIPGHTYTPVGGLSSLPTPAGVVVSDIRFTNELEALREHGGKLIHVLRHEPTKGGVFSHQSESEQDKFSKENFDFLVKNKSSKQDLFQAIDIYLEGLK